MSGPFEPDPLEGLSAFIVTADDGKMFHVAPVRFGGPNAPYPEGLRFRWQITGTDGVTHVGPPIQPDRSFGAIQQLISAWWEQQKDLSLAPEPAKPTASGDRPRIVSAGRSSNGRKTDGRTGE